MYDFKGVLPGAGHGPGSILAVCAQTSSLLGKKGDKNPCWMIGAFLRSQFDIGRGLWHWGPISMTLAWPQRPGKKPGFLDQFAAPKIRNYKKIILLPKTKKTKKIKIKNAHQRNKKILQPKPPQDSLEVRDPEHNLGVQRARKAVGCLQHWPPRVRLQKR